MKKQTLKEIKSALPNLKSQKVEDIANEVDRVLALKRIFTSEDGKELIAELRDSSITAIKKLINAYKNSPDLSLLMGLCAVLDSNFSMLMKMKDISLENELRDMLDEAVIEASRE